MRTCRSYLPGGGERCSSHEVAIVDARNGPHELNHDCNARLGRCAWGRRAGERLRGDRTPRAARRAERRRRVELPAVGWVRCDRRLERRDVDRKAAAEPPTRALGRHHATGSQRRSPSTAARAPPGRPRQRWARHLRSRWSPPAASTSSTWRYPASPPLVTARRSNTAHWGLPDERRITVIGPTRSRHHPP